jgi:cytochrome P450
VNAPGPHGLPLVGNLFDFWRDVLGLLTDSRRRFGDVVRFRLGTMVIHLVSHPEHVRQVLVTRQHKYNKQTRSSARIRGICGDSLLTGNGEFWRRQRRLMQPVFQGRHLAAYHEAMIQATADLLARWRRLAPTNRPVDVASEMRRLTYTIVGRTLFGADVTGDVAEVEEAATVVMAHTYRRLEHLVVFPLWLPTVGNLRFRRALAMLDRIVFRILDERRKQGSERSDVLSLLLRQRDEETAAGMSSQQIRNEVITLLLAGHETTANALTWAWYLLAGHPDAAARVRAEANGVLGGRVPAAGDLPRLCYTLMVIQEAMRLYPPIWIMERRVLSEDVIGGYRIPAGTTVALSPYVTHRHPDFWTEPETFDPERFRPEAAARRPAQAYFPFGAGQRLCIGNQFAMTEAQIILAMLAQEFRPELVPGFRVLPQPGITLRSKHGLPMTLRPLTALPQFGA